MIFIIFLFIILVFWLLNKKEHFILSYPIMSPSTRNMSYDLRCEPRIPRYDTGPFMGSSIGYYNRPKCLRF